MGSALSHTCTHTHILTYSPNSHTYTLIYTQTFSKMDKAKKIWEFHHDKVCY